MSAIDVAVVKESRVCEVLFYGPEGFETRYCPVGWHNKDHDGYGSSRHVDLVGLTGRQDFDSQWASFTESRGESLTTTGQGTVDFAYGNDGLRVSDRKRDLRWIVDVVYDDDDDVVLEAFEPGWQG